jgi:hypothetical protein
MQKILDDLTQESAYESLLKSWIVLENHETPRIYEFSLWSPKRQRRANAISCRAEAIFLVPTRRRGNPSRRASVALSTTNWHCSYHSTLARRNGVPTPARGNEKKNINGVSV